MKTVLLAGALLTWGEVAADRLADEMWTGAAAYDYFEEPWRSRFLSDWHQEIRGYERRIEDVKKDKPRPNIRRPPGSKKAMIRKYETQIRTLQRNQPPFFRSIPSDPAEWKAGSYGTLYGGRVIVAQVIDKQQMLVDVRHGERTRVLLSGFATAGLTDGTDGIKIPGLVIVDGTTTYNTAIGGTKTVFLVKPLSLDSLKLSKEEIAALKAKRKAEAAQRAAEEAKKQAASEAAKWRTWTTADGKFKVEAKFVTLAAGKLTLEKRGGARVSVKLDVLCPADHEFIENLKRARR
jgi:hypothetical protein